MSALSVAPGMLRRMPALTTGDDPNATARCPLRLLGDPSMPRCSALVKVRDAPEHERWHEALDHLLNTAPTDELAEWPGTPADDEPERHFAPGQL